jgi:hypothetical protein
MFSSSLIEGNSWIEITNARDHFLSAEGTFV